MNNDIYGHFLKDFYKSDLKGDVMLHNNYGEAEELPVDAFFRGEEDMPDVEVFALNLCEGKILDIGAGTGTHSLVLQRNGLDVTAIELSQGACEVMSLRGIKKITYSDVMSFKPEEKFDTLLMMMNGIGFCGYIEDLKLFLAHAKELLNNGGQILFDSSDVAYLYDEEGPETESYYGEIDYQYDYDGKKGEWFSWLYIDIEMMKIVSEECGWNFQIIYQDEEDHYLGRLIAVPI
nr:class I SAM-dependent methyltransferase [Pseudopedobacter sp.]